jgi:hypothetical protein
MAQHGLEWTENKIGELDSLKSRGMYHLAINPKDSAKLDTASLQGVQLEILVRSNGIYLDKPVMMTVAGSMSHSGRLRNMTGEFRENEFYFDKGGTKDTTYAVSLSFQPSEELVPGNYTLTVGARYDTVTYNKIVNLQVT